MKRKMHEWNVLTKVKTIESIMKANNRLYDVTLTSPLKFNYISILNLKSKSKTLFTECYYYRLRLSVLNKISKQLFTLI